MAFSDWIFEASLVKKLNVMELTPDGISMRVKYEPTQAFTDFITKMNADFISSMTFKPIYHSQKKQDEFSFSWKPETMIGYKYNSRILHVDTSS